MQKNSGADENSIKSTTTDLSINTNDYLGPPSSKLSRTQSLRTNIRPLGVANRDVCCYLVSLKFLSFNFNFYTKKDNGNQARKNPNIISKAMEYMFGW